MAAMMFNSPSAVQVSLYVVSAFVRLREAVETMIAGVLHMHDAKRWTQAANAPAKAKHAKAVTQ